MKLGLYGGAFDPPHNAHVALARAAVEQLQLDELRLLPTGDAWHKKRELAPAADRVAMAKLAFAGVPKAIVDDREVRRPGASYTIDTVRELQAERPGAQLFLVMGEDQALSLTQWREWQALVQAVTLALAGRPEAAAHANLATTGLPPGARKVDLRLPSMRESATEIRAMAARGEDVSSLVPPAVASYIASHHLYQGH